MILIPWCFVSVAWTLILTHGGTCTWTKYPADSKFFRCNLAVGMRNSHGRYQSPFFVAVSRNASTQRCFCVSWSFNMYVMFWLKKKANGNIIENCSICRQVGLNVKKISKKENIRTDRNTLE